MTPESEAAIRSLIMDFNTISTFSILKELSSLKNDDGIWLTNVIDVWYQRNLTNINNEYQDYKDVHDKDDNVYQNCLEVLDTAKTIITEVTNSK